MSKPVRNLLLAVGIAAVLGAVLFFLLLSPTKTPAKPEPQTLAEYAINDVSRVSVRNRTDSYEVRQEDGGFVMADLPAELVNVEYLQMLLDEASHISYEDVAAEDAATANLAAFGLADPEAVVNIAYRDGSSQTLTIGAQEPVSGGRYFTAAGDGRILLMKNNRTIRFTMPLTKYIDYIIVAPRAIPSVLDVIGNVTFGGSAFPQPVDIRVYNDDPQFQQALVSFGSATHLITAPVLHEINPAEAIPVFESLTGLVSAGVAAYNCDAEALAAYGFDAPLLDVAFDYHNGRKDDMGIPVERIRLRVVPNTVDDTGGYLVTKNDEGVVYHIEDMPFCHTAYEKLVIRWFLSPFMIDVDRIELATGGQQYTYQITGTTNDEIAATANGQPADINLFRSFYTLLLSAANDGEYFAAPQKGALLLTLTYHYRDPQKPDDVIRVYEGDLRRVFVEVNGVCEFAMRDKYVGVVQAAAEALSKGETFTDQW